MRKLSAVLIALAFAVTGFSQPWMEGAEEENLSFYEIQKRFDKYQKKYIRKNSNADGEAVKVPGEKQYKRWEYFWETRVSTSDGAFPNGKEVALTAQNAFAESNAGANFGQWQPVGPFDAPDASRKGIGRLNSVTFNPQDPNIVWSGAPNGGLWKSVDGGTTWTTNTDDLPNIGVSAMAIDPLHPDTMYLATGDRVVGSGVPNVYSFGLLKSVDGGETWNPTGLTFDQTQNIRIGAVHVVRSNTQIIVAATRTGIRRSTDGGATWTIEQSGGFNVIVASEASPHILFAGTSSNQGRVWRSKDSGDTWQILSSALPNSGVNRVELAVSNQDSNYVYAVYSETGSSSFAGLYRSTDGGDTWTLRADSPNILGSSAAGTSTTGQGWYDLALTVSPTNKEQIFVGGVGIWRSNDGGTGWTCVASGYGPSSIPYVHPDIHFFGWQPVSNNLYVASDGGLYRTTNQGTSWTAYYDGMNITQYYKISNSETNPTLFLAGAQDNGQHRQVGTTWTHVNGGDGMDNAINPSNNQIMFVASQYGNYRRSTNGGNNFSSMNLAPNGTGQWVTPIKIDPVSPSTIYIAYDRMWKSTNNGVSWAETSTNGISGSNDIDEFAIAKSNNQYIYAVINSGVFKSTDAGASWSSINANLTGSGNLTNVAISNTDEQHIWITRSGYSDGQKVYESFNGGNSWVNISGSLPNLPVNCIIHEANTNDGVYIGTDVGMYYRDATMSDWVSFGKGLPNVMVFDLEINYTENTLLAGTHGRGIWKSPLISEFFGTPEADLSALPAAVCSMGDTVTLLDESTFGPNSWQWSVFPSTFSYINGTSDTSQNPQVVFTAKGQYTITLDASNNYGSNSVTKTKFVSVGGQSLPFTEDFEDASFAEQWSFENSDNGISWAQTMVLGSTTGNQAMVMDFFNYQTLGQKDAMITPPLSFEGFGTVSMSFDHAYARYSVAKADTLNVYVSTDCGTTWTMVQSFAEDGTGNWATAANTTTEFIPASAADWCGATGNPTCNTISLNAFAGMDEVRIKFETVNGFGNQLYLDNININGTADVKPIAEFIADTTGCNINTFNFYDVSQNNPTSWSWSFPGGVPATSTLANPQVNYATGGTYAATLIATNAAGADTIVLNTITVSQAAVPSVALLSSTTKVCAGEQIVFTATPVNGGAAPTYYWYRNGQFELSSAAPTFATSAQSNTVFTCLMVPSDLCVTTDSVFSADVTITVDPLPVVALASFAAMCSSEDPITLTGGTPAGGTYSGNGVSNGVFDPSIAGVGGQVISYTYTNAIGCTNVATNNITVNNGPPKAIVSYANSVLKSDITAASFQYQWLDGNGNPIAGATDTIYAPTVLGDYSVELTFVNGCVSVSDAFTVTQIGLDELTLKNGINIFPNPVSEILQAEFTMNGAAAVQVKITDITGKVVFENQEKRDAGIQEIKINVANIAAGVYILEINDGKNSTQQRFVKK